MGFHPLNRDEYIAKKTNGEVIDDGAYVKFLSRKGNLEANLQQFQTTNTLPNFN